MKNSDWYNSLNRSKLTPPAWVFAPVWMILYIMMFASLFLIVKDGNIVLKIPQIGFFFIQLGLNFLWPDLFFERKLPKVAFFEILLLIFAVLFTIVSFSQISNLAAALLFPYFIWIAFAAYLNYKIVVLN